MCLLFLKKIGPDAKISIFFLEKLTYFLFLRCTYSDYLQFGSCYKSSAVMREGNLSKVNLKYEGQVFFFWPSFGIPNVRKKNLPNL